MEPIAHFFREIPLKSMEWGAAVSIVGTAFSYLIGWNDTIETLLIAMGIDYMTGITAAYLNPGLKLDSRKGMKGFLKKLTILCLVALAHELDKITGQPGIQSIVVWFFIGNEGLSILENAAKAGLPIPAKLRDTLAQLADEKHKKEEQQK